MIATKLYGDMPFEGQPESGWPNAGKLSAVNIRRSIDASLKRLQTDHLDLYQIHSLTPESTALTDPVLHRHLADLGARGVSIGVSTSGPRQADAIRAAIAIEVDGLPLFHSVQATWNPLDSADSCGSAAGAA